MMAVPAGGDLLWRWFLDLNRTRTYHAAGPNPISYSEIEAYARMNRWPMKPRHIAIIRAMDEVWLEHASKRTTLTPEGVELLKPGSPTPMTAGRFDAMFGGR